ncbi:MAG: GspE/PulE family protein [Patescibacteria group bacterium]|jgi:type IV pilus assembly protein PilB
MDMDGSSSQQNSVIDVDPRRFGFNTEKNPALEILRHTIQIAIDMRASDIHLEPMGEGMRIRLRVDGRLQEFRQLSALEEPPVVNVWKIACNMKIEEHRRPMDGRFSVIREGKNYDLRVNVSPVQASTGINRMGITARILPKEAVMIDLEQLGFSASVRKSIERVIGHSHGMLLVTGPTGSGKSTTLSCVLAMLNSPAKKIISIEDPVEIMVPGVEQMQVNNAAKVDFNFATALRAMLRRDPDIIMVGEIRDLETAEMTLRAALTGHLVLSTLHTNDATSTVLRLIDMGIEPFLVADILVGALAQRLVRRICTQCKEAVEINASQLIPLGRRPSSPEERIKVGKGRGCDACRNTGYKGRVALAEIMMVTPSIVRLITQGAGQADIQAAAINNGMRPLLLDGLDKVLAGLTTIEEVMEVATTLEPDEETEE